MLTGGVDSPHVFEVLRLSDNIGRVAALEHCDYREPPLAFGLAAVSFAHPMAQQGPETTVRRCADHHRVVSSDHRRSLTPRTRALPQGRRYGTRTHRRHPSPTSVNDRRKFRQRANATPRTACRSAVRAECAPLAAPAWVYDG